jgi:hypothetical protein
MSGIDVEELEGDLLTLARHKGGFERPEGLARDLRTVLTLDCVAQITDGKSGGVAGVAALRTVLRLCADKIVNEQTRLIVGIYFFLLTKEELDRSFLSPTLITDVLGKRREAIADLLETTPSGFRGSDERRLPALLAGELMRHEIEVMKTDPVDLLAIDDGADDGSPAALDARGSTQAIQQALKHVYSDSAQLLPLASLVVADRPPYYDASVSLSMSDNDDVEKYTYNLTLAFTAELTEYVVGYVSQSYLTDSFLVAARRLTDVYSFSTDAGRDACHARLKDTADTVTVIRKRADGRTTRSGVRLEDVPFDEYANYLPDYDNPQDAVRLLRAQLQTDPLPIRLKVVQESAQNKSDHFCYWVADRPIFVRHLRLDLRAFTPEPSPRDGRLTVQPFMMATSAALALDRSGVLDEETDNWLVRGQGFTVIW